MNWENTLKITYFGLKIKNPKISAKFENFNQ